VISLLSRFFIKDRNNYGSPAVRSAYGVLCGAVGIILNILLFAGKMIAGTLSGSISVTADAFNNLSDAGASVVTLIGFKMAGMDPDADHPFGHGRIEYISGFIVSMAIILMGGEVFISSVKAIGKPSETETSLLTVCILACSIAVKLYMALYNRSVGKKISSAAMAATSADSLGDTVSTAAVLICSLLNLFADIDLDAWCGTAVSLFILYQGLRSAKEIIDLLLGSVPDRKLTDKIIETVMAEPIVSGVHDMIVNDYGPGRLIISLHAEVPSNCDILRAHDAIDNLEKALGKEFGCLATIHMDPVAVGDSLTEDLRARVIDIVRDIDADLSIHDFRIVTGPTHTNLIFDVVVPYEMKNVKDIVPRIQSGVRKMDGNYFAVINLERSLI